MLELGISSRTVAYGKISLDIIERQKIWTPGMDDSNRPWPPRWKQPIVKRRVGMFSRHANANNVRRTDSSTKTTLTPPQIGSNSEHTEPQNLSTKLIIRIKLPSLSLSHVKIPIYDKYYQKLEARIPVLRNFRVRMTMGLGAAIFLLSVIISIIQPFFVSHTYALGAAGALLSPVNQEMANELDYDSKQQLFNFNQNYTPQPKGILGATGPQITASANLDANKGITVTDPQNQVSFTMTPEFSLMPGQQDGNRIVYPITSGIGWVVYTMHSIGVKEDVLLSKDTGDQMTLEYNLGLGSNLKAHIDAAGDIDVYGNTLLSGNVVTDDAKDAALLQKARQHAPKNTLLFEIPPPTIKELNTKNSTVKASYKLHGDTLQVNVTGLNSATYPLTIDPSIYVTSAQQFMEGNNETNIDFDVADGLIEKGPTTGARFDEWQNLTDLPDAISGAGTVAAGGYVYSVGGSAFNGQIYSAAGTSTYTVPTGVTTITVKAWGGGGGGGNATGSGNTGNGGNGGGGGFAQANLTVTPGANLTVDVGTGGTAGGTTRNGGNGGGYSAVLNGATYLIQGGGGAGGGGGDDTGSGGAGGPGGCSTSGTSCNGTTGTGGAGGGGSTSGGTAGAAGTGGVAGHAGAANAGGDAGGSSTSCATTITGTGDAGGTGGGGKGGTAGTCTDGGGGGGGAFGGGGGGSTNTSTNHTGGGGGGGSDLVTGSSTTETAGSGTTPGNSSDSYNNGAGVGGTGGGSTATPTPTAGSAGLVAIIVTGSPNVNTATVNWEQFNPDDGTLESPNPGTGSCSGWCTNSAYNLPQTLTNFSLVAYNGFLYALGGEDSSCTSGNGTGDTGVCDTVYIAKLGASGEPQLWSPTVGGTQAYWYRGSNLSSPRAMEGAVAYQNRLYMMGGITSSSGTQSVVSTDEEADITGTGTLTSWTTTGMVSLENPANNANTLARYGFGLQQYNGHLYVIGGASSIGGAPSSSVQYITLNSNGTMAGNWLTTTSLENSSGATEGKMTEGGNFSAVWGAYIYVSGGCTAVNGSGYCTSVASDNQLASINADGSLDQWNVNTAATDSRIEYGLVAWQDSLYEFGGCSVQDASTGACDGSLDTTTCSANEDNECTIDQDGDASTVSESVASGTAPCSGGSPYNCNLPTAGSSAGDAGQLLSETAILNGYLYMISGCTGGTDECSTTSTNTAYVSINSDGQLTEPPNCTADGNTLSGAWCVDSTHTIGSGVAAGGTAVFNGRIYVVGGLTGSANDNEIYYTTNQFNADGSFGGGWTGTSMTGTGVGTAVAYDYAYARANPSSAGTSPGNLYIFGGCTSTTEEGCNTGGTPYSNAVYKCLISTTGAVSSCSETSQLQITDATNPVGGADCGSGLGAMAGAVYANYIYLIGGLTPNCTDLTTLEYAEFNNSNNIVAVSGSTWIQSPMQTQVGRRRGAAFGYNGYLYVLGGYDGVTGTILPDIEFAKIDVTNGSLIDQSGGQDLFNESEVQIGQRWGLAAPVSNSYAYVLGGCDSGDAPTCNSGGLDAQVQTFQLYNNDSGSPASYSSSANTYGTNANRYGVSSAILNGYIYVAGGCTAIDCDTISSDVSYASIDSNGDIGTWASTTGTLPAARAWGSLQAAGGTLYYIGGQDATFTSQTTVYYATPSSGNVSSWSTASDGLPNARSDFGSAVWNNRLYVLGGADGNAGTVSYTSNGSYTFKVPSGVTSLTIQAWGAGGGGGAGSGSTGVGGAGGGGGFTQDTITVTGGTSLTVSVGSGGAAATNSSAAGNGGGFSAVQNGATYLIQAGGGGGGGGAEGTTGSGGAGGAGGGTTGVSGTAGGGTATTGGGGGDGTASTGGTAGSAGTTGVAGSAGAANAGGNGGGSLTSCNTSVSGHTGGAGGTGAGGLGGSVASCSGGGGGGGGAFGGGGGGSAINTTTRGGGGGGGGSDLVTGSGTTQTAGSGTTPGNSTSLTRGTAGVGGGGSTTTTPTSGNDGEIVITFGSSTMESTVYVSPQLNSGGNISTSWDTSSTSFNVARTGLTAIAYANNLYVLGGFDGTNFLSDVQFAQISTSNGDVTGSWTYSTNLPRPLYDSSGFAVDGYMYLIGGRSATTTCSPVTLVAPIDANTAISSGNDPTGVGNWYQTNAEYSGNRFGDAAVYNDGKAFVLGGACGSTYASPVTQQTTLLTQPQVAQYSIMFDTTSDVYPEKWLLNGVDNSIGAEWQLSYRSQSVTTNCASSAMTTWGQTTNFGNVTLDDPGVYTALDGSGNNMHCAEYYYIYVSIDSSEAYGYPDDVTRGPTITDLTLEFTANPSKRLMHGRTFTGGLQQPDDTPF